MKVKYIGFGGGYMEYPCYEDATGKIYFDLNDGRGKLNLYDGAYRVPGNIGIEGEPCNRIKEKVECDDPFVRHAREADYRLLSRLKADCEYFLGNGNRYERYLYYGSAEKHCQEMENLWNSFSDEDKPEWLTLEQIQDYTARMVG